MTAISLQAHVGWDRFQGAQNRPCHQHWLHRRSVFFLAFLLQCTHTRFTGREPYAGGAIYCATKHAVRSFTGSLLREVVDTPIRVTEIQPGMVETEFSIVRFRGDKGAADKVYEGLQPCTWSFS